MAEENQETADRVGILTAAYRDRWALARGKLMEGKLSFLSHGTLSYQQLTRCLIHFKCREQSRPISHPYYSGVLSPMVMSGLKDI
jgi:hypothetical protein